MRRVAEDELTVLLLSHLIPVHVERIDADRVNGRFISLVPIAPHPVLTGGDAGPHRIQGIGAGFIPEVLNRDIIDRIITVTDEDAFLCSKRLAREEGLFMGISAGAAVCAALTVARELGNGKTVAAILPDTGERYFSALQHFDE